MTDEEDPELEERKRYGRMLVEIMDGLLDIDGKVFQMSPKSKRKRRKKRRLEEEINKGTEVAIRAIQNLYGCGEGQARAFLAIKGEEGSVKDRLKDALRNALLGTDNYGTNFGNLTDVIEEYDSWFGKTIRNRIIRRVQKNGVDIGSFNAALTNAAAEEGVNLEENEVSLLFSRADLFWLAKFGIFQNLLKKRSKYDHLKKLVNDLRTMYSAGGNQVTRRYIEDFMAVIEDLEDYSFFSKRDALLPLHRREETPAVPYILESKEVVPILKQMKKIRGAYLKLTGPHDFDILGLVRSGEFNRFESVQFVADRLGRLKATGVGMGAFYRLLQGTNKDQRQEFLDYVSDNSGVVALYEKLRKAGVRADTYVDFLLSHSHLRSATPEQKTLLETIEELSDSQLKAAVSLLEHGKEFVFDKNAQTIVQIARGYPLADLVLEDYFEAVRTGQHNKAAVILRLEGIRPNANKLKSLRQQLKATPNEDLGWIHENPSGQELERKIFGYDKRAKTEAEKKTERREIPWYELLFESLKARGTTEATLQIIGEAYHNLPLSLSSRLGDVWRTQPDTMEDFCRDVNELHQTEVFQLLLKSPLLFRAYKARLEDRNFQAELREMARSESSNAHRDLYRLLLPKSRYEPPFLQEKIHDAEELYVRKSDYRRIIVWGGQYSPEAKARIKATVGVPIEVFDIFTRRREVSTLRKKDAVICVVTSMNHPLYSAIKHYCKNHNIDFYHFNRSGHNPLVEFLQQLAA